MLSIIIIVKNDRAVEDTLDVIYKINHPCEFEVIVVDSSGGNLDDVKDKYADVKWISYSPPSNVKVSIPHQRNVGLKASSAEAIVFIDASCIPVTDWLDRLYSHYIAGEQIVAGPVIPSDPDVINNISRTLSSESDYIDECPTANLLISKNVIEKIGKFDESFEYGSDTDYMWRAGKAGFKIYFEPKAVVTHDWGTTTQQLKRSFNYGKGRMKVYLKHKISIKSMLQRDPILFVYPLFLLGLPIVIVFPWYLLLLLVPIAKNFKNKPLQVTLQNTIYGMGGLKELLTFILKIKFG